MLLVSLALISLVSLSGEGSFESAPIVREVSLRTIPIISLLHRKDDTDTGAFVSRTISLNNKEYAPEDLVSISGSLSVNQAGRQVALRREARDALWNMAEDFQKQFRTPLVVISGYRSAAYQKRMWELGKCTDTLCAPPGYSEHQLGLAIDIFDATTETEYSKNARYRQYIAWMQEHAHEYGWHQSYQK